MTRLSLLNNPLLLGFDQLEQLLERVAKSASDAYPPYNIEQVGEDGLRLTLAVAGFDKDDLAITVEDDQLIIRGKQSDDRRRAYLHRGIAARQFQKSFVLALGIEVIAAELGNGLLYIELARPKPSSRVRTIEITSADGHGGDAADAG
jgi:HSP20 family molecular chaperone IbpA